MNYELMFSIGGIAAFLGWSLLAAAPLRRATFITIARAISVALAIGYTAILVSSWGDEPKLDFSSLAGVGRGFLSQGHLLAGWVHYLAIDLFVGTWEIEEAGRLRIPHVAVLPCLALTFIFAPVGLIAFLIVRWNYCRE